MLKQQKMRDNPEHIFYGYLYEDIENEITLQCTFNNSGIVLIQGSNFFI